VTDERGLFERTTLEAFQSGLSWLRIPRKRNASRDASALRLAVLLWAVGDVRRRGDGPDRAAS
jgi:hypothetical protein